MLRNVDTQSWRVASSRCYTTTHMKISSYTFKVNEIRESASKLSRFLSKVSSGFTHTDVEVPPQTMVSRFPSVSPSLLATGNPACEHDKKTQLGIVLMFRENYPVVSLLEMLKCHLKQWSLAWQLSRPAVTTPSPPLHLLIWTSSHQHVRRKPSQLLPTSSSGFTLRNVSAIVCSTHLAKLVRHQILLLVLLTWKSDHLHATLVWQESTAGNCPVSSGFTLKYVVSRLVIVLHSLSATTISISPSPYTTVCPVVSGLQSGLVLLHPSRIATSIPSISVTWKSSPYTSYAKVTRNIS